ncbi:hypothetical protein ACS0TY_003331 [Phlomoides rotata]
MVNNDVVIALDEDLIAIKGHLFGESSKLEVIPIVGMGDIVSQDYSVDEILSQLVDSLKKILEKNKMSMVEKGVQVLKGQEMEKILSLSYTHLPHHLRVYFLYIGRLPEDYKMCASKLIKLWVVEGFLKRENGCKSLEEEIGECLEDLVSRSLVLVTRRKVTG